VAGLGRNARQFYSGMGGRFRPDSPKEKPVKIDYLNNNEKNRIKR